jgi:hypothetical protein
MGWLSCVGECGGVAAGVSGVELEDMATPGDGSEAAGADLVDATSSPSEISPLVPLSDCLVQVAWPTIKGRVYTLEHCGCLLQGSGYHRVFEATGDGGAMTFVVPSEIGCAGFFRLRVSEQKVPA